MTLTTAKSDRSSDLEDEKNPPGFFEETFGFFSSSGSSGPFGTATVNTQSVPFFINAGTD